MLLDMVMGDKREYGTGTLYVGKDGCWWARWRTRDGRRPHRKLGPARTSGRREGLTKKEAEAKLRELVLADNGGERSRNRAAPTVKEMGDALIARMRRDDLKKSHIETASGHLRKHINPLLGDMLVSEVVEEGTRTMKTVRWRDWACSRRTAAAGSRGGLQGGVGEASAARSSAVQIGAAGRAGGRRARADVRRRSGLGARREAHAAGVATVGRHVPTAVFALRAVCETLLSQTSTPTTTAIVAMVGTPRGVQRGSATPRGRAMSARPEARARHDLLAGCGDWMR